MPDKKLVKQILIIDDEPQIRSLLTLILEREGFNVIVASDGKEGIKLFQEEKPDIVITDLIMPGKEGIETIRELKKENPILPIIAMSGGGRNAPDSYLQMAKLLGANAVFEKPFEKEVFLNAVKKFLGNEEAPTHENRK